jgi:nucleoside-diphosphate-sugar epimerase
MRVLVTGGAGYVGCVLIPMLLKTGHRVTLMDRFAWGVGPILHFATAANLRILVGDVRDASAVAEAVDGQDAIVHLAAVVGYPACDADPDVAVSTNILGTQNIAASLGERPLVFASTSSVYGRVVGCCTDESPTHPLTLYGETKLEAESIVREAGGIALRFATLFGVSPRLRLDVLVNDFVQQAVRNKRLDVYQSQFRRTFLHVNDAARSCALALERFEQMRQLAFNVADERTSMTKLELAEAIREQISFDLRLTDTGVDHDDRDYDMSCARIRAIGFSPGTTLQQGIREVATVARAMCA